ncbi:hypothetical protein, partial [Kurthia gibsonii]|uniref:hypothetical protein n=1 Tax=Kurthia gibsonii TaxID=33946 RepID=UPI001C3F9869
FQWPGFPFARGFFPFNHTDSLSRAVLSLSTRLIKNETSPLIRSLILNLYIYFLIFTHNEAQCYPNNADE